MADELTSQQLMVDALAKVCQRDWHIRGQATLLGKFATQLVRAGYTTDQVEQFGKWWYKNDWRGKKGDPPAPHNVTESIGRLPQEEQDYHAGWSV